jgi:hypothetical protein
MHALRLACPRQTIPLTSLLGIAIINPPSPSFSFPRYGYALRALRASRALRALRMLCGRYLPSRYHATDSLRLEINQMHYVMIERSGTDSAPGDIWDTSLSSKVCESTSQAYRLGGL